MVYWPTAPSSLQTFLLTLLIRAGTKNPTQYSSKFELGSLDGDGTTVGRLTSVDIDAAGKVMASYSNGDQTYLAQVAMVKFANPQGLTQAGNTSWRQSLMSGEALAGEANSGTFGAIQLVRFGELKREPNQ